MQLLKAILKGFIAAIPAKRFVYTALRRLNLPQALYCHLYFNGPIKVTPQDSRTFRMQHWGYQLENELFWRGYQHGFEAVSLNVWAALCHDQQVIIDIGANTGVYALAAKTIAPDSKVIAFEAVPRIFEKLRYNIKLNEYDVDARNTGISNQDGTAKIYVPKTEHSYSASINGDFLDSSETEEINLSVTRLDSYLAKNNIPQVDLIKIDVEGHELAVFEGMEKVLQRSKPDILVEILDSQSREKIYQITASLGYRYFIIDESKGLEEDDKLSQGQDKNYLLLNPQRHPHFNAEQFKRS